MMKFRSIWFALLLAACGTDDRSAPTRKAPEVIAPVALPQPAPIAVTPTPAPVVAVEIAKPLPTKYNEAMEDGQAAIAKGDAAHARELFEAAVKLDKKQAEPHIELARMFIAAKEKGLAIAAAKKAVKLAPDSSRAWNTLGRAELARWSYQGATAAFTKAAELDPDNAWAWNNLGYTELEFHSYQAAADALAIATTKAGVTGYMWNNLGTAYEHVDQLDEARDAFEHGGKLGSREAVASRKRLEGVTTMIATYTEKKPASPVLDTAYPHDEDPNETPAATEPTVETPSGATESPSDAGVLPASL